MAAPNIEDHMRSQLNKRSIQPSPKAWSHISETLDLTETKKRVARRYWMGIAASFIGGIFITTLFFRTSDAFESKGTLVEIDTVQIPAVNEFIITDTPVVARVQKDNKSATEAKNIVANDPIAENEKVKNIKKQPHSNEIVLREDTVENKVVITHNEVKLSSEIPENIDTQINKKVNDLVKKIAVLEQSQQVTEHEIDRLLQNAQREIISKANFDQPRTVVTNAEALLLDVEADLGAKSFKDKIFNALKEGFISAREAVATRND